MLKIKKNITNNNKNVFKKSEDKVSINPLMSLLKKDILGLHYF